MPAKSKAERRWMGARLAEAKEGHNSTGMSIQQLRDFASTKEAGLPYKKRRKLKSI